MTGEETSHSSIIELGAESPTHSYFPQQHNTRQEKAGATEQTRPEAASSNMYPVEGEETLAERIIELPPESPTNAYMPPNGYKSAHETSLAHRVLEDQSAYITPPNEPADEPEGEEEADGDSTAAELDRTDISPPRAEPADEEEEEAGGGSASSGTTASQTSHKGHLRGGADNNTNTNTNGDDNAGRVPRGLWWFAGGVGRPPKLAALREQRERERAKGRSGKFWNSDMSYLEYLKSRADKKAGLTYYEQLELGKLRARMKRDGVVDKALVRDAERDLVQRIRRGEMDPRIGATGMGPGMGMGGGGGGGGEVFPEGMMNTQQGAAGMDQGMAAERMFAEAMVNAQQGPRGKLSKGPTAGGPLPLGAMMRTRQGGAGMDQGMAADRMLAEAMVNAQQGGAGMDPGMAADRMRAEAIVNAQQGPRGKQSNAPLAGGPRPGKR